MKILLSTLIVVFLSGCAGFSSVGSKRSVVVPPLAHAVNLSQTQSVKNKLLQQHKEWKSAPYVFGGLSKSGVDCSGFVYLTYRSKLGYELPRSTEMQSVVGKAVAKNNLQTGDLVFFRTGMATRHVGIVIGNGKFLHASSSKGVIISRLDNVYWASKYWMARRIS